MIYGCASLQQVGAPSHAQGVGSFIMVFSVAVIALVRTPEIDQAGNIHFWSSLVIGPQRHSPGRQLKAQVADRSWTENRDHRSDQSVVAGKAAAAGAGIGQTARIEAAAGFPVVGEGVSEHQCRSVRLVVKLAGRFGL